MNNRVYIFDTTLRDGEQSPGATMNLQEKLRLAEQLEKLGVDCIEAGFPASSQGDFEAVKAIAEKVKNCQVAGLARCMEKISNAHGKRSKTPITPVSTRFWRLLPFTCNTSSAKSPKKCWL